MHGQGKSDNLIVPETPSNKGNGEPLLAEKVEGSELVKVRVRDQRMSNTGHMDTNLMGTTGLQSTCH